MHGQLVVRHAGQLFQAPEDFASSELTAGELQVSVLLFAAGLTDRSGHPTVPDLLALKQLPAALPEASCEFRLWCQMMPLEWSDTVPCRQQAQVLDLRRRKSGSRCQTKFCTRCQQLASMHKVTLRWLRLRKEAAEQEAAMKAATMPLVVNIRYEKRIAPIVLPRDRDEQKVSVGAALVSFSFRLCAAQRWQRCAACRRLQCCETHFKELQEILYPAVVPPGTCTLQLWQGLSQLDAEEDLEGILQCRTVTALVAKVNPKSPQCAGMECQRCKLLADADPSTAAFRRRRHFWRWKRGAFLLRFGKSSGTSPLVEFLRTCPEQIGRAHV